MELPTRMQGSVVQMKEDLFCYIRKGGGGVADELSNLMGEFLLKF